MNYLIKGTDPNAMHLLLDGVEIVPYSTMNNGIIQDGVIIKFSHYNLESVLAQMLDDYGEEEIIKKIKQLD